MAEFNSVNVHPLESSLHPPIVTALLSSTYPPIHTFPDNTQSGAEEVLKKIAGATTLTQRGVAPSRMAASTKALAAAAALPASG